MLVSKKMRQAALLAATLAGAVPAAAVTAQTPGAPDAAKAGAPEAAATPDAPLDAAGMPVNENASGIPVTAPADDPAAAIEAAAAAAAPAPGQKTSLAEDDADEGNDLTVNDMVGSEIPADELVDDDGGANEAAEAAALTPTQAEADEIAADYINTSLTDAELPASAAEAALPAAAVNAASEETTDAVTKTVLEADVDAGKLKGTLAAVQPEPAAAAQPTAPAQPAIVPDAERVALTAQQVAKLQKALKKQGIAVSVDGVAGKNTKAAVRSFQNRHGLTASGEADPKTLDLLGVSR